MTDTADRPVHVVVDCSPRQPGDDTPRVVHTPLTDAEMEQQALDVQEAAAQEAAEAAQRAELSKMAAEHPDPLVQALAKKAGLL